MVKHMAAWNNNLTPVSVDCIFPGTETKILFGGSHCIKVARLQHTVSANIRAFSRTCHQVCYADDASSGP